MRKEYVKYLVLRKIKVKQVKKVKQVLIFVALLTASEPSIGKCKDYFNGTAIVLRTKITYGERQQRT